MASAVRAGPRPEGLAKAERCILTVLAQYPEGRRKNQVALLAGYAVNGGGFNNAVSSCRSRGWLEGRPEHSMQGLLRITEAGLAVLGAWEPLPTGRALVDYWLGQLAKAERSILEALVSAHPTALTKQELGERAGYEPSGGGFNNALSKLRTLELIEGRGELRASEGFFE